MPFTDVLSAVERRRKTVVVYSSDDEPERLAQFELANATVEHRTLPDGSRGFVVLRDDGFVASIGLDDLQPLLEPPIAPPWDHDVPTETQRALYALFDDTLFSTLDRRQLLGAAREIETRAWRVGVGTLRVGFQRLSVMQSQVPVYSRLADETDLEIQVYGDDDWEPPPISGVTYHRNDELDPFWFLVYDGGGTDEHACALVAEERQSGTFFGFWTYDPQLVTELESSLETIDGAALDDGEDDDRRDESTQGDERRDGSSEGNETEEEIDEGDGAEEESSGDDGIEDERENGTGSRDDEDDDGD